MGLPQNLKLLARLERLLGEFEAVEDLRYARALVERRLEAIVRSHEDDPAG